MPAFKVIIVGGSVTGFTLANILERYDIDYILLEKHRAIAPQLGASIALMPNGSRILEQLNCYDQLMKESAPVDNAGLYGPQGYCFSWEKDFGLAMEEILGYKMRFLDRQKLIQILFDNLKDKSKVHTSCDVAKLELLPNGVSIHTSSSETFHGDIAVGADGVHSRIREEMWRIAELLEQGFRPERLRNSITCTYRCIFGISECPPGVLHDSGFRICRVNRSYLCQRGPAGKMYWFAFYKNPEKTIGAAIPSYTSADEQELAEHYADDVLFDAITFGDVYKRRINSVLVPLEEFVLEECFYKRAVLVGDSFHKLHPLTGQGGNAAIESAAMLADLLKGILKRTPCPESSALGLAFSKYQQLRRARVNVLMKNAHDTQRLEALETPLLEFIVTKVISQLGLQGAMSLFADLNIPAQRLQYLPPPQRNSLLAYEDDVIIAPAQRSTRASMAWVVITLSAALIQITFLYYEYATVFVTSSAMAVTKRNTGRVPYKLHPGSSAPPNRMPSILQQYSELATMAINGLWTIESHRSAFLLGPLISPLPFVLASLILGWDIVVPIYFGIYILLSRGRAFYYPSPRAIKPCVAKALPLAFILVYTVPFTQALRYLTAVDDPGFSHISWNIAHISFPLVVSLCSHSLRNMSNTNIVSHLLYGDEDIRFQLSLQGVIVGSTSAFHGWVILRYISHQVNAGAISNERLSSTGFKLASLALSIFAWCLFTLWDLQRVRAMRSCFARATSYVTMAMVAFGPAATLALLWGWREIAMEKSRARVRRVG